MYIKDLLSLNIRFGFIKQSIYRLLFVQHILMTKGMEKIILICSDRIL